MGTGVDAIAGAAGAAGRSGAAAAVAEGPPVGAPPWAAAPGATGRAPTAGGFTVGAGPPVNTDGGACIVALNVDDRELGSASSEAGAPFRVRETTWGAPGKFPMATVAVLLLETRGHPQEPLPRA